MNKFRTHTCGELTKKFTKKNVILSGWINKKRDHGNLLFVDLRDHYGITQCVICLLYTSPSPRDRTRSRMPSSA